MRQDCEQQRAEIIKKEMRYRQARGLYRKEMRPIGRRLPPPPPRNDPGDFLDEADVVQFLQNHDQGAAPFGRSADDPARIVEQQVRNYKEL